MTSGRESIFHRKVTPTQSKDSGMALVLIFLIIGFIIDQAWPFKVATGILIMNMIWPGMYKPFAWFWYGLAEVLGSISSKVILTLVYVLIVFPVGMLRKALGKDKLILKKFKKDHASVMVQRNHQFDKSDLEQLF